ncbi:hypothetical protein LAZ67_1007530 [Cordylochernes scorpioides]|uniref:Reverse transcriptase domain-containing protein n=1 Tax=Cordylochernes scorpioides TaxID=51811 RepID=A0ABY6JZA6_9ARAC|nr:hypothetical protein LAZ67_1007530 [Cordylochernes scorpioides]
MEACYSYSHTTKATSKSLDDFRPISLLPIFGKIFERIILKRLQTYIDTRNVLIPQQFGFRANHSTTHQLITVIDFIQTRKSLSEAVGVVLLDFKKAFDMVWHRGLIIELTSYNFPQKFIRFLKNYLQDRTFSVKVGTYISSPRQIESGVPQGSILSPILFNLYINDIPHIPQCRLALFADDTALLSSSRSPDILNSRLQNYLEIICNWCDKWKLNLNPKKSQAIIFPPRNSFKFTPRTNLIIYSSPINWTQQVKYLGVTFDSKLKFTSHVKDIIRKSKIAKASLSNMFSSKSKESKHFVITGEIIGISLSRFLEMSFFIFIKRILELSGISALLSLAWLFGVGLHPEAMKLTGVAKATIYKYHLGLEGPYPEIQCLAWYHYAYFYCINASPKIRAHYEHMSEFETGRAIGLKEAGWSNRLIVRHLCRSDAAIRRCWQKLVNNGRLQRQDGSGRPRATTEREDRAIVRIAVAAPESTLTTIQRVTGTQVSKMTINRRLRERNLRARRPLRCLPLTPVHRQVRLQWCRERSTWNCADWGRIVFSDESRFLLCPDDRRKRRVDPGLTVEHHTGPQQGVMVWGAISFDSKTPLVVIPGTLTAQWYVDDILRPVLLPLRSHHPWLTFQQDNAGHTRHVLLWIVFNLAELFRGQQGRLISRP